MGELKIRSSIDPRNREAERKRIFLPPGRYVYVLSVVCKWIYRRPSRDTSFHICLTTSAVLFSVSIDFDFN